MALDQEQAAYMEYMLSLRLLSGGYTDEGLDAEIVRELREETHLNTKTVEDI